MDTDFDKYLNPATKPEPSSRNGAFTKDSLCHGERKISSEIRKLNFNIAKENYKVKSLMVYQELISNYKRDIGKGLSNIKALSQKIDENIKQCKPETLKRNENGLKWMEDIVSRDIDFQFTAVENSCFWSVEKVCELIQKLNYNEYSVLLGLESFRDEISKEQIWSSIENISTDFTPEEITDAFLNHVKHSNSKLKTKCSQVDIKKDTKFLKFEYQKGSLNDISEQPEVLKTSSDIVEEKEISHFKTFLKCNKTYNESWKMKKNIDKFNEKIKYLLYTKFKGEKTRLVETYFHLQQECNSFGAVNHYLDGEIKRIENCITEKEESLHELQNKFNQIHNFERVTQAKQKMIQKLIQTNSIFKSQHQEQVNNILDCIKDKLLSVDVAINELCDKYQTQIIKEMECCVKIPLQKLQSANSSNGQKSLISQFSINRLNTEHELPGQIQLNKVKDLSDAPQFLSSDYLIGKLKDSESSSHLIEVNIAQKQNKSKDLFDSSKTLNDIQEELMEINRTSQCFLPKLEKNKLQSQKILAESVKFHNAAEIWWKQPAQSVVPWVTEEDLNLLQYSEKYSELAAKLTKFQVLN